MSPQSHATRGPLLILFDQRLALARRYAKMTSVHRFTSENSDKLFHLPSLGVKHFPFNVVLFSEDKSAPAFGRQALPMVWDYADTNPFAGAGGDFIGITD